MRAFRIFSYLLIVCISFGIAIAAGGGGGSSSSGSSGGSSSSSSSSGGGSGGYFSGIKCDDTGRLSFDRKPKLDTFILENTDDGTKTALDGEYDSFTFSTEEAFVTKAGNYQITDPVHGAKKFTCPGLKFSCRLVNLSISSCEMEDGKVYAEFSVNGVNAEDLAIRFQKHDLRILSYSKSSYSPELKDIIISGNDGRYMLEASAADVKKLEISYPGCTGKYYSYSTIECGAKSVEEHGKKLKCGGYMEIKDRVRCRIDLRAEQASEYENFFPEECKAREDQDDCIAGYIAVQECWDFPNGNARISCVKRQLKLADIFEEKANCNALDSGKRENCNGELRDKVYGLVKFRLYNLEEEAEHLEEEGILSRDKLVDFVVKMENHKLAFNKAADKDGRKSVVLQAKEDWLGLIKKVKA